MNMQLKDDNEGHPAPPPQVSFLIHDVARLMRKRFERLKPVYGRLVARL